MNLSETVEVEVDDLSEEFSHCFTGECRVNVLQILFKINQVIADKFCKVGDWDNSLVMLYHRCAQGDGVSPALVGVGADRRKDFERELKARHLTAASSSSN